MSNVPAAEALRDRSTASSMLNGILRLITVAFPLRTLTRCTPSPDWILVKNRSSSPTLTWASDTSCSRCTACRWTWFSRTTGGKAGRFLVTGPGWTGEVPEGMTQVKSPSKYRLIHGRTHADGTEQDYEIVNAQQAQCKLTPLSEWGKGYTCKEPPVNGFWSLTMYEVDNGWWFVPNELNKFNVSPRNDLKYADNGSLTLYLQSKSPGKDKESNWLPTLQGAFVPMLRMYWPKTSSPSIINATWKVPVIKKVE